MRGISWLLLLALLAGAAAAGGNASGRGPNVVFFLADDLGYGDLGLYGNDRVNTPALDSFGPGGSREAGSAVFEQMYAPSPLCTPSRAATLTARYPVKSGLASCDSRFRILNSPAHPNGLSTKEYTLPRMFKDHGYSTFMAGKWHLGLGAKGEFLPTKHGFDSFYGLPMTNVDSCAGKPVYGESNSIHFFWNKTWKIWSGMLAGVAALSITGLLRRSRAVALVAVIVGLFIAGHHITINYTLISQSACLLYANDTLIEQPLVLQNMTERLVTKTEAYITAASASDQPFFVFLSFLKTHTAMFTTPAFTNVSESGVYGDNVEELDWAVGRVLDHLDSLGLTNDTVIVFSSDNGPYLERCPECGSAGAAPNRAGDMKKLRGGKSQTLEGGIRMPTVMRFPGVIPETGLRIRAPVTLMDVMPTLSDLLRKRGSLPGIAEKEFHHDGRPSLPPNDGRFGPVTRPMDGRSLLPLLSGSTEESPHEVIFHYSGDRVAAVRMGEFKAHWFTPGYTNTTTHTCFPETVCGCAPGEVVDHSPPLLFNIIDDPSELTPLAVVPDSPEAAVLAVMASRKAAHEAAVASELAGVTPAIEAFFRPWLFPCCGTDCTCVEGDGQGVRRGVGRPHGEL